MIVQNYINSDHTLDFDILTLGLDPEVLGDSVRGERVGGCMMFLGGIPLPTGGRRSGYRVREILVLLRKFVGPTFLFKNYFTSHILLLIFQ